ncbi:MAG: hypothetical protein SOT46_07715 [Treponema sp.]|nr:hypothetical protein [Treponema sp.]
MKKIVSTMLAGMLVCGALSAQSIKVTNTFGGDADSTGGSDLFVFDNQKNEDGTYKNNFENKTRVSDRLQLDAGGEKFDGHVRLEIAAGKLDGKESTVRLRGYGRFKPVDQFQIISGNDFSTKVAVDSGYLAASDDNPKYGRILQSGLGAISNWALGEEKNINLKIAGGVKGKDNSFMKVEDIGLDAGLNFGIKNIFSTGATFQNITGENRTIAAFAGLNAVENLTLNAGYIYNDTDTDYIPAESKNVISVTAGYNFKDIGLFAAADVISSVGETKNPFLTKLNVSFKATDSVSVGAKAKISMTLGETDSIETEVYPNATYNLPDKMGSLSSGVRMNINKNGITKFAVPFSWKCTLADIKK